MILEFDPDALRNRSGTRLKDENDNTRKGLKIAKSRNGKTGRCDMVFDGSRLSFIPEADEAPFGA